MFKHKLAKKEQLSGILIKIFTNYFQIVAVISSFHLSAPPGLVEVTDTVGNPVK